MTDYTQQARLARVDQPLMPSAIVPAQQEHREHMVYVPGPGGQFVAVPKSRLAADYFSAPVQAPAPAAPRVGIDSRAQILAAGGVAAAGIGWGTAQALSELAALGPAGLVLLAALILAARTPRATRPGSAEPPPAAGGTTVNFYEGSKPRKIRF